MSRILSKWVVLQEYELDGTTAVDDELVRQWMAAARDAYLDRCEVLRRSGLELGYRAGAVPSAELLGHPRDVVVTATATEFRPTSFTISVRIRPGGGEHEMPLNTTWVVSATSELGNEIRDELIALEHAAEHYN
jgi:hypothetical protein